jgi:ATP-dependent Clp protease adaptor protein ClpS
MRASTKELKKKETSEDSSNLKFLILFNDEHNTFEYVIECLVRVCGHTYEQAEQSAMIAHYKGKCDVAEGTYEDLKIMKDALIELGLSAVISE